MGRLYQQGRQIRMLKIGTLDAMELTQMGVVGHRAGHPDRLK
jgi:hypothetical protein